jgi:hypothetical protein
MGTPRRKARQHRVRSLQVYVDRDAQAEAIVKNTERDLLALLASKEHTLRSLPSLMKEIDRLLASQEKALLATINGGLTDMGLEASSHAIDSQ